MVDEKYGITNYSKAMVAASCPSLIKFKSSTNLSSDTPHTSLLFNKWKTNSLHLGGYILGIFILPYIFKKAIMIEVSISRSIAKILEAEGIVIYCSCLVRVWV